MYLEFFGLKEKPFNVTPDPHFLYMSPSHQEAFANLLYGVRERKGFIMVTGEVGTGKTTLLHNLLDSLEDEIQTVFVFHTCLEFDDLLEMIHHELDIPIQARSKAALLQSLNRHLIEQLSENRNVALIIDEAQNLSPEILENLRLLSNLETSKDKLLQIVLVGQPELTEKMALSQLRQLRQRVSVSGEVKPLTHEESKAYILHRLAVAGATGAPIMSDEALKLLVNHAAGVPRRINVLCDNALLIAYADGNKLVGASHALEAIRDLSETTPAEKRSEPVPDPLTPIEDYREKRRGRSVGARIGGAAAVVAVLAVLLWGSFNLGSRSSRDEAGTLVAAADVTAVTEHPAERNPGDDAPVAAGEGGGGESVAASSAVAEPEPEPDRTEVAIETSRRVDETADAPTGGSDPTASELDAALGSRAPGDLTTRSADDETTAEAEPAVKEERAGVSSLRQEFWRAGNAEQLRRVLDRCGRIRYQVASGDHFIGIVFDHTGREDAIVLDYIESMNPHIHDYDHIEPGWVLYLPDFQE